LKRVSKQIKKVDAQIEEILEKNSLPSFSELREDIDIWKSPEFLRNLSQEEWIEVLQQIVECKRKLTTISPIFQDLSEVLRATIVQQLDQVMRDINPSSKAVEAVESIRNRAAALARKLELKPLILCVTVFFF